MKELFVLTTYQNLIISLFGTSLKFKKNLMMTSYTKSIVSNFYNLSDETVNYYVSFILLREIIFSEYEYFYFYFNEYINIYRQVVNYYLIRSLKELINIYLYNDIIFLLNNIHTIINIYMFLVSIILLDILESTMYSELGSRANSMTNSIQNSKENVKYYTLIFNRYRQAKITNEIIEIISSSNI
jgi:F0F1-type ATP synthase gamma subunit